MTNLKESVQELRRLSGIRESHEIKEGMIGRMLGIEPRVDVSKNAKFVRDVEAYAREVERIGWKAYQKFADRMFMVEFKKLYNLAWDLIKQEKPEWIPFISRMDRAQIDELRFTVTTRILDFMAEGKKSKINFFGRIPSTVSWGF